MERSLLLQTPDVRAIRKGYKTQHRLIMNDRAKPWLRTEPGSLIWVQETFAPMFVSTDWGTGFVDDYENVDLSTVLAMHQRRGPLVSQYEGGYRLWFMADARYDEGNPEDRGFKWTPACQMPKKAARTWLQVESVREERLQDITAADAWAHGLRLRFEDASWLSFGEPEAMPSDPLPMFQETWDCDYARNESECWAANPTVLRIEFSFLTNFPLSARDEFSVQAGDAA